ncbi:MAG: carboxymuconolactone decarboxylase family protein [Actinomycetota bacterium]|nr:carboxymuconolactone decarboxylase family protein [Actinomycetota bacterium]
MEMTNAQNYLIEDADARGELAGLYEKVKGISLTGEVDDVIRCLSLRPDFLASIVQATRLHFTDGALTRAQHELIASYVSALNRYHYCLSAHTSFLQLQGKQYHQTAQALRDGDLEAAGLNTTERLLLQFVGYPDSSRLPHHR